MSRIPAMTPLLNGQAVKIRLVSTSVTATSEPSSRLIRRATVAPAKPPPITTTCGIAWAMAGRATTADATMAAAPPTKLRRVARWRLIAGASALVCVPAGDGLDLGIGKPLGDLVHHGGFALAGAEGLHLLHDLGRVAADEAGHRAVLAAVTAGARLGACRHRGDPRRGGLRLGSHREQQRERRDSDRGDESAPRIHADRL